MFYSLQLSIQLLSQVSRYAGIVHDEQLCVCIYRIIKLRF